MSRVQLGTALIILSCLVVSTASAQPTPLADRLIGTWEGNGNLFGRDAAFDMTWEWVLDHKFLRLTFSNGMKTPDGVQPVLKAQALYKPLEDGGLEGTWFDTRGVVQPLRGDADATALTVHWGSPETEEGRTIYRVLGEDRLEVEDSVLKAGEWSRFAEATYQRVKPGAGEVSAMILPPGSEGEAGSSSGIVGALEFQRTLGGSDMDRGVFVSPTSDGGYIVVGVTASEGAGGEDIYLIKMDPVGETEWTRTFGGTEQDNGWVVREIDSGYVVGGYTRSFGSGGFDFYLLTTDFDGEPQWSRTYGGETDDRCWGLLPTPDGGYVLVGETVDAESGSEDGFLVKTDAAGKEEWSRTYGGTAGDRLFAIAGADDGGFLLVGQTYSEGAGDRDAYVIKTDANGRAEWSRTFGGAAKDVGHGVDMTADGNFLITGYTQSFATGGDNPYLIKIDAQGDTLWTSVLAVDGVARAITGEQAADGGFYLTGFRHQPADGSGAALLVRTDQDGRLEWTREYLPAERGEQSFGYTVRATSDGGCVLVGHTSVGTAGDLDLFLVKVEGPGR